MSAVTPETNAGEWIDRNAVDVLWNDASIHNSKRKPKIHTLLD
jgi:hypothetical protein